MKKIIPTITAVVITMSAIEAFASEHFLPISDPVITPPSDLSVLWAGILYLACLFFFSATGLNDKKDGGKPETKSN
jgi:hypothetical protein